MIAMKTRYMLTLAGCLMGAAWAQMPASNGNGNGASVVAPSAFDASGSSVKPESNDPNRRGETPNPQLFGMEIPLMDPSTDTVSYNGGYFDVGNNAVVRARFEKYLQQNPDNSDESKRYRKKIQSVLEETQKGGRSKKYIIGSAVLVRIGLTLYQLDKYPGDGGQSGVLASAIVSVLDAQRKMHSRDKQNEKTDAEMESLLKQANSWQNTNEYRREQMANAGGGGAAPKVKNKNGKTGGGGGGAAELNALRIADNIKRITQGEASKAANKAANEAQLLESKITYQSLLLSMLMQRRFDHVVIGARIYRHLFQEGDTRLNIDKESKANEFFSGGAGLPPTVNGVDSVASNARREVDQNIEAVHNLLAQNKLAEATQHLIEAVAIGEYMQSVATFPTEARRRISVYWTLRKTALTALNARNYAKVEEIAAKMKEMDQDFDDSFLLSYTAGKKRQSDLAIRNAAKALRNGNEEEFNKYIEEAGMVWPLNPKLDEARLKLEELDEGDPMKDEFRKLYNEGDYRKIAARREELKVVALDPELAKKYEEVITLVMKMDGMLEQLNAYADQDVKIGPCAAYEKLVELFKEDERYAADKEMRDAMHRYENLAHDFVDALRGAESSCERREFGSALSAYYRAQCKYPQSKIAKDGIRKVTEIIVKASYD